MQALQQVTGDKRSVYLTCLHSSVGGPTFPNFTRFPCLNSFSFVSVQNRWHIWLWIKVQRHFLKLFFFLFWYPPFFRISTGFCSTLRSFTDAVDINETKLGFVSELRCLYISLSVSTSWLCVPPSTSPPACEMSLSRAPCTGLEGPWMHLWCSEARLCWFNGLFWSTVLYSIGFLLCSRWDSLCIRISVCDVFIILYCNIPGDFHVLLMHARIH